MFTREKQNYHLLTWQTNITLNFFIHIYTHTYIHTHTYRYGNKKKESKAKTMHCYCDLVSMDMVGDFLTVLKSEKVSSEVDKIYWKGGKDNQFSKTAFFA